MNNPRARSLSKDERSRRYCMAYPYVDRFFVRPRLSAVEDFCALLNRLPEHCLVASVTLCAEASFVFVVFLVTADTSHRRDDLLVHALSVACQTVESFVAAVQFEAGASVVGKVPELPVSNAMAFLALSPQPTLVHVVALMAGITGSRRLVLIELSHMTTLTGDRAVLTNERVLGVSIMVEGHGVPVLLAMTGLAFLAKI